MPDASVVIATHNRASQLVRCLQALAQQSDASRFETIVVDNGSQDETPAVIAAATGERVRGIVVPNQTGQKHAMRVLPRRAADS